MTAPRALRLVAVLACLALFASCSGGAKQPARALSQAPAAAHTPSPQPAPSHSLDPEQPAQRCGAPLTPARLVAPRTSDGVVLAAAEVGTGSRGVLLVPELGNSVLCGWWQYAVYLAGQGFHVLLFDQRCTGHSACPMSTGTDDDLILDIFAALTTLHADGAGRVVLVGASRGAAEVLISGARAGGGDRALAPVTAVAAFSPDLLDDTLAGPPFPTANRAAPQLRLPALLAVAPGDQIAPVPNVQRLYATIPARDKHLYVVNDQPTVHGWSLLDPDPASGRRPAISDTLLAFLAKYAT
jgi:dienelactone hydrolase